MKCLLIQTKDKRKFFTHEKNLVQLIEFSKTFGAEISMVKLEEGPVLELKELAPAICNPAYKKIKSQYSIIETKLNTNIKSREEILTIANKVKKYISEQFKSRKIVSLKELKKKFQKDNLTNAALCNHIRRVKQDFEKEGIQFTKIGAGEYRIT